MIAQNVNVVLPIERTSVDIDEFYQNWWRRRPVIWRGCADEFFSPALDWPEVDSLESQLVENNGGSDARRSPDGSVLFINRAQHLLPRLGRACTSIAKRFDWEACTADISVTRGHGAGVGCHFDNSDNFVVQQQGVKRWRVGLPENTAPARQRSRMLETAGFVPRGSMPEIPLEIELHRGDVLYLPIFAPHEGVESGAKSGSISVTFSYNAESALQRHFRPLLRLLSEDEAWWGPLPVGGADEHLLAATLRNALSDVLTSRRDSPRLPPGSN